MKAALIFALAALAAATPVQKRASTPTVNSGTMTLIKMLEGFHSHFSGASGYQIIGFGYDCAQRGDCASIHPPITREQGVQLLADDLPGYEACVCTLPNASELNANQFGALTSFAYNSGCGGLQHYFTNVMQAGEYSQVCNMLSTANIHGGDLSPRRLKESAFCSQPTSIMSGCGGTSA